MRKQGVLEVEKPEPGTMKRMVTVASLTAGLGQATRCLRTLIGAAITRQGMLACYWNILNEKRGFCLTKIQCSISSVIFMKTYIVTCISEHWN